SVLVIDRLVDAGRPDGGDWNDLRVATGPRGSGWVLGRSARDRNRVLDFVGRDVVADISAVPRAASWRLELATRFRARGRGSGGGRCVPCVVPGAPEWRTTAPTCRVILIRCTAGILDGGAQLDREPAGPDSGPLRGHGPRLARAHPLPRIEGA